MSIYAHAFQAGASMGQLAFTGENAETKAVYNATYQEQAALHRAGDARHQAELNMASIQQDKILSNVSIQMNQDQAEANAKVAAATAGVSGSSVKDVIYETQKNEAMRIGESNRSAASATQQQRAAAGDAAAAMESVPEAQGYDLIGNIGKAISAFAMDDAKTSESLSSLFTDAPTADFSLDASNKSAFQQTA